MHEPERRKFKRLSFGAAVDYAATGRAPDGFVSTSSKNLSTGGVCIITFEQLNVGDVIDMRIALPRFAFLGKRFERYLYAQGRVIWTNALRIGDTRTPAAYESGVDIFNMDASARALIHRFTQARLRHEQDTARR
jgi:hypothetical protein